MFRLLLTTAAISFAMSMPSLAETTIVDRPDSKSASPFYDGNRPPLSPSPLVKLPIGAVRPQGWVRKQLELQAAGFHGHLGEISKFLSKKNNAWLSPKGEGEHGWEEVPYWLKGFGDCAYLLGDEAQIREAKLWIEGALSSQLEDGYFGPRPGIKRTAESMKAPYDLWPNMVMLDCLQSYHEFSGDKRVLELMTKYFRWELNFPEKDFLPPFWQHQRAADNLWSVYWLYNRTGEPWLLELATKIHKHTAKWSDGIASWHNVNMAQAFAGSAFYAMQSGEARLLASAERNWQSMRNQYGQVPGGMFGGDENCRPGYSDPRQAIETCGMVEMMYSHERMLAVTADVVWSDRTEDVAFNSLPAALTADFKALRYLTSPNLISSDSKDKSPGVQNKGPMFCMDPHNHRCCQHNFGHGWPYFSEHLWMATPDRGLAAVFYPASEVKARVGPGEGTEVTVRNATHYPFDEQVTMTVSTPSPASFPLYLRIPGWCRKAAVSVNGEVQNASPRPQSYFRINRMWKNGDKVELTLPMEISVRTWSGNHDSVSIDRGPITWSLKIGEKYVRAGRQDPWPAWDILPTTPWNYALELDAEKPASSFEVVNRPWPENNEPFTHEGTPLELVGHGRRVSEWQADKLGLVGLLQQSPVKTTQPLERITLIPMGAARLRISSFPVVGNGPNARAWQAPSE